jgi:hypothetical protein
MDESASFRNRAQQCLTLAATARDDYSRQTLRQMASELEAEALKIESEGTAPPIGADRAA